MRRLTFWIWWDNEPRGIALDDGGRACLTTGSVSTEQGWRALTENFERVGDVVYRESIDEGRDCEGPCSRTVQMRCDASRLAAEVDPETGIGFPAWESVSARGLDEVLEEAGY